MTRLNVSIGQLPIKNPLIAGSAEHLIEAENLRRAFEIKKGAELAACNELARGVILTLANPAGVHFVPACARVILSKIENDAPAVGFIHPGDPAYASYMQMLESVTSDYALFADGRTRGPLPTASAKSIKVSKSRKRNGGDAVLHAES